MADTNNGNYPQGPQSAPDDKKSIGFGILSFFIPLVGLILFIVWKKEYPKKAKSAGIGAIIGVALYIIFVIFYTILFAGLIAGAASAYQ